MSCPLWRQGKMAQYFRVGGAGDTSEPEERRLLDFIPYEPLTLEDRFSKPDPFRLLMLYCLSWK